MDITTALSQAFKLAEKEIIEQIYNTQPLFGQPLTDPERLAKFWPCPWQKGGTPDFTTALCEGWAPPDNGLQQAIYREEERLRKALMAVAEEWGIDIHYDCGDW